MTSSQINITNSVETPQYVEFDAVFWFKEIALQLAIANELQVERNEQLKKSVDLQEDAYMESLQRNMTDLQFQTALLEPIKEKD